MRTWKLLITLAGAMTLIFALNGCEGEPSEGVVGTEQIAVDDYDQLDFDLEFGGLSVTDEEEGFGDPYLLAMAIEEEDGVSDDPLLLDPEVLAMEDMAGRPENPSELRPRFTFVRLLWGMLDGPVDELGRPDESLPGTRGCCRAL